MSNYKIDDKLFTASKITLDTAKTSRRVEIELSTRLTAGEHTIKLAANKVSDLATLKNIESEITFVVEAVTEAPTAYVVKATTTKVTFKFDREVTKTPTVKFGSTSAISVTQDSDDKTQYDAIFATGVIPNAGGDLTIVKAVEDFYGNKTTADLKLPFVPTFDNEKPEVVSITSEKEGQMIVEFSEDIANPASGSFTVKDKDGDRVASITVSYATTDSGKRINNKALVKGNFKPADGPYKVSIKNVKDLQGNPMVEVTDYEVAIPDKSAPTIVSAVKNVPDNKLAVTFSEEVVGAADIENFKYEISSKGIYAFPSGTSAEMTSNNKSVIFTFPNSWSQGDDDYTITNVNKIYISGVEDYAGNVMDDIGYTVIGSENLSTIKSVKATAKDTIKIEYNDDGKVLPSTLYAGDFIVTDGSDDYTVSDATMDGRTIVLTMADELPGDTTGITVETVASGSIQGTKTALGTEFEVAQTAVTDKIVPSVKADDIEVADDGTVVVTLPLTEELDNFDDDAILVKVDGDILANGIDYNAALNGTDDAIEITFENTFDLTMDIVISIPDSAVLLGCYDNGGNALKAMAAETVSFDLADAADGGLDVIAGTVNVDYKISSGIIYLLESYVTGLGADPTIEIVVTDGTDPIDMDGSGKYSYKSFDGNNWTKVENPALEDNVVVDAVDTVETQLVAVDSGVMYKVTYEIRIVTTLP